MLTFATKWRRPTNKVGTRDKYKFESEFVFGFVFVLGFGLWFGFAFAFAFPFPFESNNLATRFESAQKVASSRRGTSALPRAPLDSQLAGAPPPHHRRAGSGSLARGQPHRKGAPARRYVYLRHSRTV